MIMSARSMLRWCERDHVHLCMRTDDAVQPRSLWDPGNYTRTYFSYAAMQLMFRPEPCHGSIELECRLLLVLSVQGA